MLNEKQFRERAARELREIGNQVSGLATDREIYRRTEGEILQPNAELGGDGNAFADMFRGAYADATTMRLRRLLAPEASLSLRRVIDQLVDYPDLLHQKVNIRELADDSGELDKMATYLKEQVEAHFLPRERTPGALAPYAARPRSRARSGERPAQEVLLGSERRVSRSRREVERRPDRRVAEPRKISGDDGWCVELSPE